MSDDGAIIEEVTRTCPECGEEITGPARGPGNVAFKVGMHRRHKHGYKAEPKAKKSTRSSDKVTPLSVVRDAASEVSDRSTKPPTVEELTKAGARLVGTVSVFAASYMVETDPTVTTESDQEALLDYLSFDAAAAKDVAYPFARFFGRSSLNARVGRTVVDNVDVAAALAELGQMGMRWRRYLRERDRRIQLTQAPQYAPAAPPAAPAPVVPTPAAAPSAQPQPQPAPMTGGLTPPPERGVVMTPAMLAPMNGAGQVASRG